MRHSGFLLSLLLIPACSLYSQSPASAESELRAVMQQRRDALQRGDAETYSKLTADDLVLVDDDGVHRTKASVLEQIRREGAVLAKMTVSEVRIQVHGDTGIITYRVVRDDKFGSQAFQTETRELDTYKRQDGKWILITRAIVPLSYPNRTPAKIDFAVYSKYAGVYDFGNKFLVTVQRDGNKLAIFNTEDKTPQEVLPFSESNFYQNKASGVLTFVRDTKGNVVALEVWDGNSTVTGRKIGST